jgi:hypothetical protein
VCLHVNNSGHELCVLTVLYALCQHTPQCVHKRVLLYTCCTHTPELSLLLSIHVCSSDSTAAAAPAAATTVAAPDEHSSTSVVDSNMLVESSSTVGGNTRERSNSVSSDMSLDVIKEMLDAAISDNGELHIHACRHCVYRVEYSIYIYYIYIYIYIYILVAACNMILLPLVVIVRFQHVCSLQISKLAGIRFSAIISRQPSH